MFHAHFKSPTPRHAWSMLRGVRGPGAALLPQLTQPKDEEMPPMTLGKAGGPWGSGGGRWSPWRRKLSSNCGCVWLGKAGKDPRFVKALSWKAFLVVEQHRQRWRGRTTDKGGGGKQPAVLLVGNTVCCSGRLLLCLAHASGNKDFFLSIVPLHCTSKLP